MLDKNHSATREKLIESLNHALATEVVCVLRYTNHYYQAMRLGALNVSKQFLENLAEERTHADKLAERIFQLGEVPKLGPSFLVANCHSHYTECSTIADLIKDNLAMERLAIKDYRQLLKFIDEDDVTTQRLIEDILASEEEHESELLVLEAEENHLKAVQKNPSNKYNATLEHSKHSTSTAHAIYLDQTLSKTKKIALLTSLENELQNKAKATEEGMLISGSDESNAKEMQMINNLLIALRKDTSLSSS